MENQLIVEGVRIAVTKRSVTCSSRARAPSTGHSSQVHAAAAFRRLDIGRPGLGGPSRLGLGGWLHRGVIGGRDRGCGVGGGAGQAVGPAGRAAPPKGQRPPGRAQDGEASVEAAFQENQAAALCYVPFAGYQCLFDMLCLVTSPPTDALSVVGTVHA